MLGITELAEKFYKKAALFQAPPRMVEHLARSAREVYAATVMYNCIQDLKNLRELQATQPTFLFKDKNKIKELESIIDAAKRYSKYPRAATVQVKTLPVMLDGWKYATENIKKQFEYLVSEDYLPSFLTIRFVFQEGNLTAGSYNPEGKYVTFILRDYTDPTLIAFRTQIEDIYATARHELEHFGQDIMSTLFNFQRSPNFYAGEKGQQFGTPGKRYHTRSSDIYGRLFFQSQDAINKKEKEHTNHALIDTEFYTNLGDSVSMFKKAIINLPREYKKEFVRLWVGEPNNVENMLRKEKNRKLIKTIVDTLYIYNNVRSPSTIFIARQPFKALLEDQDSKEQRMIRYIGLESPENRKKLLKEFKDMRKDNKYRKAVRIFYAQVGSLVEA